MRSHPPSLMISRRVSPTFSFRSYSVCLHIIFFNSPAVVFKILLVKCFSLWCLLNSLQSLNQKFRNYSHPLVRELPHPRVASEASYWWFEFLGWKHPSTNSPARLPSYLYCSDNSLKVMPHTTETSSACSVLHFKNELIR